MLYGVALSVANQNAVFRIITYARASYVIQLMMPLVETRYSRI